MRVRTSGATKPVWFAALVGAWVGGCRSDPVLVGFLTLPALVGSGGCSRVPETRELPFVLVHGAAVGALVLLASAAAGAALFVCWRRRWWTRASSGATADPKYPVVAATGAVVSMLLSLVALLTLGAVLLESATPGRSLARAEVAAVTPFLRKAGLERAARIVEATTPGRRRTDRLIGLWSLQERCGRAILEAARWGRPERAIELAADCDDPAGTEAAGRAAMLLGAWETASDLIWGRTQPDEIAVPVTAHLLAGRWERVAHTARDQAAFHRGLGTEASADRARTADCLADWAEHRASAPGPERSLLEGIDEGNADCLALLLDVTPAGERRALFERWTRAKAASHESASLDAVVPLLLEAGLWLEEIGAGRSALRARSRSSSALSLLTGIDPYRVRISGSDRLARAALEARTSPVSGDELLLLAELLLGDAVVRAWLDDLDGAGHQLDRVESLLPSLASPGGSAVPARDAVAADLAALRAAMALYQGDAAEARRLLSETSPRAEEISQLIALREEGVPSADPLFSSQEGAADAGAVDLWRGVVAGDATPIAAALHPVTPAGHLERPPLGEPYRRWPGLYLVAHRFTAGKEVLQAHLDHGGRSLEAFSPERALLQAVRERDLRRSLGDDGGARHHHARVEAFHAAVARRDVATPLRILSRGGLY